MPFRFLTDALREQLSGFPAELDSEALDRFFTFSDTDLAEISRPLTSHPDAVDVSARTLNTLDQRPDRLSALELTFLYESSLLVDPIRDRGCVVDVGRHPARETGDRRGVRHRVV